jgi:2-polyprenyl-3-methyl-5-hydroxy-6-metoxy-1,4-benzoquinol methylase
MRLSIILFFILFPFHLSAQFSEEKAVHRKDSLTDKEIVYAFQTFRTALYRKKQLAVQKIPKALEELSKSGLSEREKSRLKDYMDSIRLSALSVENFRKAKRTFQSLEFPEEEIPFYLEVERELVEANQYLSYFGHWTIEPAYPHILNKEFASYFEEFNFLQLHPNEVIAEVGAQFGSFSLPMAIAYPEMEVYLNDIDEFNTELISAFIEDGFLPERAGNLKVIQGNIRETLLPKGYFDHIILRNTYHHFTYPEDMLQSISQNLKPNGSLFLLEDVKDHPTDHNHCDQSLKTQKLLDSLKEYGYQIERMQMGEHLLLLELTPAQAISQE